MNSRIERVIENMKRAGLEQILVSEPTSVYYLTGMRIGPGERMLALYIHVDGEVTLYANRLFALSGCSTAPLVEFDDVDDCVGILAKGIRAGKIGIDKFWASQFTIRLMEARGDIRPVLGSAPVDDARMCKDAAELECMRESSRLNDETLKRTIAQLREGMTELEVCEIYKRAAAELGVPEMGFDPLICFGANCAEPHHSSDNTTLKRGDSIILDVGLRWKDYCSDMTRTAFFGAPTEEQQRVFDLVLRANEAGRAAAKPGVKLKDIDRAAREVIEEGGYGEYFIHRLGHGIGLQGHEYPDCSSVSEVVAKPGMVFSIEPGIYLPGKFGVRIEDLIAITEDGAETLNALDRGFHVIG